MIGGLAVGVVESLVGSYQRDVAPWLGDNFAVVVALRADAAGAARQALRDLFGTPEVDGYDDDRLPTAGAPRPAARPAAALPLLRPGAGAVQHPAPSRCGSAVIVLVGVRSCRSCSTDSLLQTLAHRLRASRSARSGSTSSPGYAGQVSLGHAFFLGVGAYTAAAISGDPDGRTIGFGITNILVWLPAAGAGRRARRGAGRAARHPAARALPRHRHARPGLHRRAHLRRVERPHRRQRASAARPPCPSCSATTSSQDTDTFTSDQNLYLLMLVLLLVFALGARNLARSRVGRAFAAVRDRDMAAEMMGINLPRDQDGRVRASRRSTPGAPARCSTRSSASSSPSTLLLLLSVQFIAMVLIGGRRARSAARSWARCSSRCCRR